jgi:hypothetical protein
MLLRILLTLSLTCTAVLAQAGKPVKGVLTLTS